MSKLQYLVKVWDDLEQSYADYIKKNPVTKKDYLKQLIAFDDNPNGSTILENYLSDEVETYNAEEYELYDNHRMLFNKVYDNLKNIGTREIQSFNDVMQVQTRGYNKEDFKTIAGRKCVDPSILLKKGFIMNTTILEDNKINSYYVDNVNDYIVLNDARQLSEFLYKTDSTDTEFGKTAYVALMSLAKSNKLTVPIVIMGSKYFEIKNKKFIAGAIRHSYVKSDLGKVNFDTLFGKSCEADGRFVIFKTKFADKYCTVIGVGNVD